MSSKTLSTTAHGPLLRRALARAAVTSTLFAGAIFALAAGPALVRNPTAFAHALLRAASPHAPDISRILHASTAVQIHLATIALALVATAILLAGVKGSSLHRTLGWIWTVAMTSTAVAALFIKAAPFGPHIGPFGALHLFAVFTLVGAPWAAIAARRHDVPRHARLVSGFVVGGFVIAGLAAFLPGRLMWAVFFG